MRMKQTPVAEFRRLVREVALLIGYEITRDLPLTPTAIETPLMPAQAPLLAGKKVCFVDPSSTSGYLFPSYNLLKAGVDPKTDVTPVFAGKHDVSVQKVAAGTECRTALGVCDVAESCTGLGASCPPDSAAGAHHRQPCSAGRQHSSTFHRSIPLVNGQKNVLSVGSQSIDC